MRCILNVTDHEYDKILQLTHDRVEWNNRDVAILKGLTNLVGAEVVEDIEEYHECRMEKYDDISGMPRVMPDLVDAAPTRIE